MTKNVLAAPKSWKPANRNALAIAAGIAAFAVFQLNFPPEDPWVSAFLAVGLVAYGLYLVPEVFWGALTLLVLGIVLFIGGHALEGMTGRDFGLLVVVLSVVWLCVQVGKLAEQARQDRIYVQQQIAELSMRLTDEGYAPISLDDDETEWSAEQGREG